MLLKEKKIGKMLIDKSNELFRYPEMNNGITLDYVKLLKQIKKRDIKSLRKRVDILLRKLNDLGYFISVEMHQRVGKPSRRII